MVTAIDEVILQIKESLESNDMLDNSIIIFASDNGGLPGQGANNLPLRGGKNSWFEGGVKTPSFVYSPLFDGTLTSGSDNEWYVFCSGKKNFVAKSDQKPKTKNKMNETKMSLMWQSGYLA